MFYEMAKRYDDWAGEQHQGSSCRGAVKGWDKHGICSETLWPYLIGDDVCVLTEARAGDALTRPLGAYFRVGAKDLAAMHSALAEVGILYVMAGVHEGWHNVAKDGSIPWPMDHIGAHAFAIVAYDEHGFWVQNSKGPGWGLEGFARLSYEDWLANGQDVWIVRLGVPIAVRGRTAGDSHSAHAFAARRPHIVSLSKEGRPRRTGTYATSRDDIAALIETELPAATKRWKKKRVLLYAPSGLGDPKAALQRFDAWREMLLEAEIYPLMLDWASGFAPALGEILAQAKKDLPAKPAGKRAKSAAARDLAAERLDKALAPIVRREGGERLWAELRAHAAATTADEAGGLRFVAQRLAALAAKHPKIELHLVGHSLGALLLAGLVPLLTGTGAMPKAYGKVAGLGAKVASCTLWAPAITVARFKETLGPAIKEGTIGRFTLVTLSDTAEKNDTCGDIYNKSLLYLVANALERTPGILGLELALKADSAMKKLLRNGRNEWIVASGAAKADRDPRSTARHHDDFAGDVPTLQATVDVILGAGAGK
jgi:hypothetical protein